MRFIAASLFSGCLVLGTWQLSFLDHYVSCLLFQAPKSEPATGKFDEFDYTTSEDENARLDRFAEQLKRQPKAKGVIIAYRGRIFRAGLHSKASERAAMARSYVAYVRGIHFNRLMTIDGGLREQGMMELWLVRPGAPLPTPSPTLPPEAGKYCPYLQVSGPAYVWAGKRVATFAANVLDETKDREPRFNWRSSGGEIVSGQGTRSISVQLSETGYQPTTVNVEVGGYASECNLTQSVTAPMALTAMPYMHGKYGDIGCDTEISILATFASVLRQEPELRCFIVYYAGRRFRGRLPLRGEAEALSQRAKFYLAEIDRVDTDRIRLVNGGFRDEWTAELWLSPMGAKEPIPTPTKSGSEIKFGKGILKKQIFSCKPFY